MLCDFCATPDPTEGFTCSDFVIDIGLMELPSSGSWASCAPCAVLVRARDLDGLLGRASVGIPEDDALELARAMLTQYYVALFSRLQEVN